MSLDEQKSDAEMGARLSAISSEQEKSSSVPEIAGIENAESAVEADERIEDVESAATAAAHETEQSTELIKSNEGAQQPAIHEQETIQGESTETEFNELKELKDYCLLDVECEGNATEETKEQTSSHVENKQDEVFQTVEENHAITAPDVEIPTFESEAVDESVLNEKNTDEHEKREHVDATDMCQILESLDEIESTRRDFAESSNKIQIEHENDQTDIDTVDKTSHLKEPTLDSIQEQAEEEGEPAAEKEEEKKGENEVQIGAEADKESNDESIEENNEQIISQSDETQIMVSEMDVSTTRPENIEPTTDDTALHEQQSPKNDIPEKTEKLEQNAQDHAVVNEEENRDGVNENIEVSKDFEKSTEEETAVAASSNLLEEDERMDIDEQMEFADEAAGDDDDHSADELSDVEMTEAEKILQSLADEISTSPISREQVDLEALLLEAEEGMEIDGLISNDFAEKFMENAFEALGDMRNLFDDSSMSSVTSKQKSNGDEEENMEGNIEKHVEEKEAEREIIDQSDLSKDTSDESKPAEENEPPETNENERKSDTSVDVSPKSADEVDLRTDEQLIDESQMEVEHRPQIRVKSMIDLCTANNFQNGKPSEQANENEPKQKPNRCINVECVHFDVNALIEAPEFIVSHFQVTKKSKVHYVCDHCFDDVVDKYEELCTAIDDKQPLYQMDISNPVELVEISDSSDDEDDSHPNKPKKLHIDVVNTVQNNLDELIDNLIDKLDVDTQLQWNKQILHHKFKANERELKSLLADMKKTQKVSDDIYRETYRLNAPFIIEFPSPDPHYIPKGVNEHTTEFRKNDFLFCIRTQLISSWAPCRVLNKVDDDFYDVQILSKIHAETKRLPRKQLAYYRPPLFQLNVGDRVIAQFNRTTNLSPTFYVGVVGEPLKLSNKFRYLVFFDDGFVRYVQHDEVRLVCAASKEVWRDAYHNAQDFLKNYLENSCEDRQMAQLIRRQRVHAELRNKWYNAIVCRIDASLVEIHFKEKNHYEWIYRGSPRLISVYRKMQAVQQEKETAQQLEREQANKDTETEKEAATSSSSSSSIVRSPVSTGEKRAVAKKSVSQPMPRPTVKHLNNSTIYVEEDNKPKGRVVYYTAKKQIAPRMYSAHECSPSCLYKITHNLSLYSPLSKALLSGWERQIGKCKWRKWVIYRAPCGRRLRNMNELHRYLRITNCSLNVDNFDYDAAIHCLGEYVIENHILQITDLSFGKESMPVPCVNFYDDTAPPECEYSTKRIPTEGVDLNLDKEFLCGCDCTDDCADKLKCKCWQLTLAGARFSNATTRPEDVGYIYRRLYENVMTGIYECNSNCKCKKNCLNRVAQNPLQMKLQVFKTGNRGWGLRCLNDISRGSFVCCYAGHLLTEQAAIEMGRELGDEYHAELDYIEAAEGLKEGYESDVVADVDDAKSDNSSSSGDSFDPDKETRSKNDSDEEFVVDKYYETTMRRKTRYETRNSTDSRSTRAKGNEPSETSKRDDVIGLDDSDEEVQPVGFTPTQGPDAEEKQLLKFQSVRKFYGPNENVYIMDAKKAGNIGRYFNHSCSPNLFVQNVFVDTHDLRFPWVAFFAMTNIRAGTELTWNYNYELGSVPGKILICQCGSESCRGRLL